MALETKEKKALLKKIVETVSKQVPRTQKSNLAEFTEKFYGNTSTIDLAELEASFFGSIVSSMWSFTETRKKEQTLIRAYTPTEKDDGWTSGYSHIEIVLPNKPFVIDSITNELLRRNLPPELIVHPILYVKRDKNGKRTGLNGKNKAHSAESTVHVIIPKLRTAKQLREVEAGIASVLGDVSATVRDFDDMLTELKKCTRDLDVYAPKAKGFKEKNVSLAVEFLEWLLDDNFIFLGYREYAYDLKHPKNPVQPKHDSSLGVLEQQGKDALRTIINAGAHSEEERAFAESNELLLITKSSRRSTVHRSVFMDIIGIKRMDKNGNVIGERRFIGLYTSRAYSRSAQTVPVLKDKIDWVINKADYDKGGHNSKALIHILETFPRDDLFQIDNANLVEIATGIVQLQERRRTAIFVREDRFDRYISCQVFMPRETLSTQLRIKLEEMLEEEFDGKISTHYITVSDSPLARINYIISYKDQIQPYDLDTIEMRLAEICAIWVEQLRTELYDYYQDDRAEKSLRNYQDKFSEAYKDLTHPSEAMEDILECERISDLHPFRVLLTAYERDGIRHLGVKLYNLKEEIQLSSILPILENMGLTVISEYNFEIIHPELDELVFLHDFKLADELEGKRNYQDLKNRFEECLQKIWQGANENDGFNRLIMETPLNWSEIFVIRAYASYLKQGGFTVTRSTIIKTLCNHAGLTAKLFKFFDLRFNPGLDNAERAKQNRVEKEILKALETITNASEDRILRTFLAMMKNTLRTNFYQHLRKIDQMNPFAVAFKFSSRNLDFLPHPRPMFEIYVFSSLVEGVHLRGGKVARGGLRWSDRLDDYRTEILGLVKAQLVKNAVIVPTGSKGGFAIKKNPHNKDFFAHGQDCYRIFIRNLLSVTDNLVKGKATPPADVVRYDEDDPYLVVAADKGTATFSDIANDISIEHNFWLGDAFASGGTHGYDHKKMAITARGAWVAVQRHFREMGLNTQKEEFTAIGIGDMAGDVFGNGLLRSKKTKLIAAFNHMHIFVDPNPDAEKSFKERQRLFKKARSTWMDYDQKILSKGGAIFERNAKTLKLSKEIMDALDIPTNAVTPNELMRYILLANVDLLWFGGIGTYVKSFNESDADADDRANDAIRVDAKDLRVKVIGEGANLGITQLARVEYALKGGRLNTDAIDNSGGVDCSDHEVNIKILLNTLVSEGRMDEPARNKLLAKMTTEVGDLVLRDNYLQTQCITFYSQLSYRFAELHERFLNHLEHESLLDKRLEFLPDEEVLKERIPQRVGFTRPEYAVILAYGKIFLKQHLLASDYLDHPIFEKDLINYFPTPLREEFREDILKHPLRREIIATQLTNRIVARMGGTFIYAMHEASNAPYADIAKSFVLTEALFGLEKIYEAGEKMDYKVDFKTQHAVYKVARELGWDSTFWFLTKYDGKLDFDEVIATYDNGIGTIRGKLDNILHGHMKGVYQERVASYTKQGVPAKVADMVSKHSMLSHVADAVYISATNNFNPLRTADMYFQVGETFGLNKLIGSAKQMPVENDWHRRALDMLVEEIYSFQAHLAKIILTAAKGKSAKPAAVLNKWYEQNKETLTPIQDVLAGLEDEPLTMASLTVFNGQLRSIVQKLA